MKLAYLMSRFPKVTETFILYEILELEKQGTDIEIFPLLRERENVMHPEAENLVKRTHYHKALSLQVLKAQLYWLFKKPGAYLKTWWKSITGNIQSPKFLTRALVTVPLAALFARKMQALHVEHIHAHYATHPALAAYVIHQLTRIPYSITAHAHDIYVDRSMLGEKLADAKQVITISDYNKQLLSDLYGAGVANKIQVIHCGIDPDVFQPRQHHKADEGFTMICVASLQDYKGQRYLIEACHQLKDKGVDFTCLLVGDGNLRQEIEQQIQQLNLEGYVQLLGRQPRQRVSELLASSDVMVLPSVVTESGKKEGIPVALMEALAVEMPVIATRISGIPELIEHEKTGFLVPERDADALAETLLQVYESPDEVKQYARAGREKVLAEFNLRTNSLKLYELFASLK